MIMSCNRDYEANKTILHATIALRKTLFFRTPITLLADILSYCKTSMRKNRRFSAQPISQERNAFKY